MQFLSYNTRVVSHEQGAFKSLRDSNILIYFPHGFGDWVQFSGITPYLEPSNRYWITRFGDDNTSLLEGHPFVTPVYLGINSTHGGDGESEGNRHFGMDGGARDGGIHSLLFPRALTELCRANHIDAVFWNSFPESWGSMPPPFHSKARHLLPHLVDAARLNEMQLDEPLQNPIDFSVPLPLRRWVDARLSSRTGWGQKKLCLICRNGYTATGKNWGHMFREDRPPESRQEGAECREFMQLMLRRDPDWVFVVLEDRFFEGQHTVRDPALQCYSYADLFGPPEENTLPFGWIMKALVNRAELSIGVPAGPYHLSMAKPGLPTIGLWIEHLPSWYDEPKTESLHLISRNVRDRGFLERPGSFLDQGHFKFNSRLLDTRVIEAAAVLEAVEQLIG